MNITESHMHDFYHIQILPSSSCLSAVLSLRSNEARPKISLYKNETNVLRGKQSAVGVLTEQDNQ